MAIINFDQYMIDGDMERNMNRIKLSGSFASIMHEYKLVSLSSKHLQFKRINFPYYSYSTILHSSSESLHDKLELLRIKYGNNFIIYGSWVFSQDIQVNQQVIFHAKQEWIWDLINDEYI